MIRVGLAADLVVFDENTISDKATFNNPHQYPIGISTVLVNGKVTFSEGKMTGTRNGQPLRLNH